MEFFRRPNMIPPNQQHGQYFPVQPNSIGTQRQQFVQMPQPAMRNPNPNDEGVLNLDSVFVHAPNTRFPQIPAASLQPPRPPQYHYPEGHPSRGMVRPEGFINSRPELEYYDPMYPTSVSTPNVESGWGQQFFGQNEMKSRGAYSTLDHRSGQMNNPGIQMPFQKESAFQQTQSQFTGRHNESVNQLQYGEEMTANLPMFLRNTDSGRGPIRDGNILRAAPPRNTPPSTGNAVSLSVRSTGTMNAKLTYQNDLAKNHSISNANFNLGETGVSTPRDRSSPIMSTGMNQVKSPRLWVFTDVVTHICDDYGFVGSEIFFQTCVVKGDRPQVGDTVLIEAEAVEGMQFKWNGKKVQVISKKLTQNSNVVAKSNKPEGRPVSPTRYFSDVLDIRSSTKTVGSHDQNFLASVNTEKPFRNPPPPPNISKEIRASSLHSKSRRSRSRSIDRGKERGRNRENEIYDQERRRKFSSSKVSQRHARSRSRSPQRHHRSHHYDTNSPHKRTERRDTFSSERLVSSSFRKRETSPDKSDITPGEVFKVTTITKLGAPTIRIAPLRSESNTLIRESPNASLPPFYATGQEGQTSRLNLGDVRDNQASANLARKSILKPPSDIFSNSATILPNPAYNPYVAQQIAPQRSTAIAPPLENIPRRSSTEIASNQIKPISIRLGFLESKRQENKGTVSLESKKNTPKESASHSKDPIKRSAIKNKNTTDNRSDKDRNVGSSPVKPLITERSLQSKSKEEQKDKASHHTNISCGDKSKHVEASKIEAKKNITHKSKITTGTARSTDHKESARNVTNLLRRKPATSEGKSRKTSNLDEQGEKERRRKAYYDRVKNIRTRTKEIQSHRSKIEGKRISLRDGRPHSRQTRICHSPKVQMEPFVEIILPGENEFMSEAEIAEREQELIRQEMQLNEEQQQLEEKMAELGADNIYLSEEYPGTWSHEQNLEFNIDNFGAPIGPSCYRDDEYYPRSRSPFYQHDSSHHWPDLERHPVDHFERMPVEHPPWGERPNSRPKSPELAYFRIDRRSPCRIAPPENSPEKANPKFRGNQQRKFQRKPRPATTRSSEFRSRRQAMEGLEPFPPSFDNELTINEMRRRADEALMSEELGEDERRLLRGESFQSNNYSNLPYNDGIPHVPLEMTPRFVFGPEPSLLNEPEGVYNNPKPKYPKCGICGKKGHFEHECWHRPNMNY